jgi:hypothetical protein
MSDSMAVRQSLTAVASPGGMRTGGERKGTGPNSMSSHSDNLGGVVFGFGAGIYLFFKGFRVFREYRVLADTPEVPIRSLAMGLVEIHGQAKGEELVDSPVSRTPCLFYKVDVEKWQRNSKGGGSWSHYRTDADGVRFYLEDVSGKVLVDAHGAEFDLLQSARRQIGSGAHWGTSLKSLFSSSGDAPVAPDLRFTRTASGDLAVIGPPTEDELFSYVASGFRASSRSSGGDGLLSAISRSPISLLGGSGLSGGAYRLTEYCLLPDHWYDVTGTCAENPSPRDEHDRNLIAKGENEPTFLISWRNEKDLEKGLRRRAALYVFGGAGLSIVCLAILLAKFGWL